MKNNKFFVFATFLFSIFINAQTLKSPDGKFEMNFQLKDGVPFYNLKLNGKAVISDSKLGLRLLKDNTIAFDNVNKLPEGKNLNSDFVKVSEERNSKNENWQPVLGEKKFYLNNYNELAITLNQPKEDRKIIIKFRLFNDGLGFRYEFPEQKNLNYFVIREEDTEFNFPFDMKAWWIPADYDTQEYKPKTTMVSQISANWQDSFDSNASQTLVKNAVQTPLMLKKEVNLSYAGVDKPLYINLAEAAVIDYPASHLEVDAKNIKFKTHLTPDAQGAKGYIQTPAVSPWRTIIVSEKAEEVLASKMIFNLNEPTKYTDTSWIHPTKYMGVWWKMFLPNGGTWSYANLDNVKLGVTDYTKVQPNGTHQANNENVKKYINFASKHGFDAILVEGWNQGWEDWFGKSKEFVFDFLTPYPDFDIKMLNEYAHSKGIKIIMHHETSASATNYERWMEKGFQQMKKYGYDAVKTGYVGNIIPRGEHHYSQWMIQHYQRVVDLAAQYKIMVDSHESVRPTGLSRTFPNWIAAEAARGTEFEAMGGNNPDHQTILPFTRYMGGPMDYTPGIFQTQFSYYDKNSTKFASTTLAKQLALYVVMYSPLQMACDLPENYEKYLDAFKFIEDVALDWDDTKILSAEPEDYIHTARKAKGTDNWFVGGITDENARDFTVDFSFLDKGKKYEAIIYEDGKDADYEKNPMVYHIYKQTVTSNSKIKIHLARSGGYAISVKFLK